MQNDIPQHKIKDVLYNMDDVDVGVWWGTANSRTFGNESRKWYMLYPMDEKEKRARKKLLKDFDNM